MGIQTMSKQSENRATSLHDEPNKLNPAKDELNEQDLNKVAGGCNGTHYADGTDRNTFTGK